MRKASCDRHQCGRVANHSLHLASIWRTHFACMQLHWPRAEGRHLHIKSGKVRKATRTNKKTPFHSRRTVWKSCFCRLRAKTCAFYSQVHKHNVCMCVCVCEKCHSFRNLLAHFGHNGHSISHSTKSISRQRVENLPQFMCPPSTGQFDEENITDTLWLIMFLHCIDFPSVFHWIALRAAPQLFCVSSRRPALPQHPNERTAVWETNHTENRLLYLTEYFFCQSSAFSLCQSSAAYLAIP